METKLIPEYGYLKSLIARRAKRYVPVLPYVPATLQIPNQLVPINTSWHGIEIILTDLIDRFGVKGEKCLEFGVEHGYSTVALSNFFKSVVGVDTFGGDKHTGLLEDIYETTSKRLAPFDNIRLVKSDYKDWIRKDENFYDLIHVDIIHTYADTFTCGLWSANHSSCTLFHDTLSFPEVMHAVIDISRETGKTFYNFQGSYGLGIVL
jgi:hypothetical protein